MLRTNRKQSGFGYARRVTSLGMLGCAIGLVSSNASADPPVPSSAHPRLFMSPSALAAYTKNATAPGTAAAALVAQCQDTLNEPSQYATRGGSDSSYWPGSAVACAFAYLTTQNATYLTQALTYWNASLNDDQTLGDGLGCVQGVSTNWQTWAAGGQNGAAPPVILTITHDTGYPMRWYGPDIAATYDWLYSAPGVTRALLAQTRTCLTNWSDYYTAYGYHATAAGSNYNAGYVAAKALSAIAIGNDDGADGHLWTQVLDTDVGSLLEGTGMSGAPGSLGAPVGLMVGGDWGEGWEYGPIAVLEYAAATAALEGNGASLPGMDGWADSLVMRDLYATTPSGTGVYCGNGDCDITTANDTQNPFTLDAVLLGAPSAQSASWAQSTKQTAGVGEPKFSTLFYDAVAETRGATAAAYTAQATSPPLSYVAQGTRELYARSAWSPSAYWGVFMSSPQIDIDHQHFAATNFVFSHGSDDLIVDPSPYGGYTSWETNAVTADSAQVAAIPNHDFAPSQTVWSNASLPWARASSDATFGARGDFAHAFDTGSALSDIPYAHREWTMLPEGEVVLIDRVDTGAATRNMYVTLHTNTGGGGLAQVAGGNYAGVVGSSQVVIHPVVLGGATPAITQPSTGNCTLSCSYPCGQCDIAKFAVDEYRAAVPGPWAVAVHVVDGLASGDSAPTVDSMNDATIDPGAAQNGGVVGAAVLRSSVQSYVVASSARDGVSPATMTYGVPGATAGRHVVYDAPEAADGTSAVTTTAQSGRCVVSIAGGAGNGVTGHPLMFQVAAASAGCQVTSSASAPPAGGGTSTGGGSSGGGASAADAGTVGATPPVAVADAGTAPVSEDGGTPTAEGDGGGVDGGDTGGGCSNEAPTHLPGTNGALMGLVALLGLGRKRRR